MSDPSNVTDFLDFGTDEGGISGKNTLIVVSKNSGELFDIFNQAPIGLGTDYQDKNNPNDKSPDGRGLTYSLNTQTGGDEVALAAVNGDASGGGNDPADGDVAIDLTYNVTPYTIYSSIANPNPNPDGDQDLLADGEVLESSGNADGRSKSTARVGERLIGDVAEVIVLDKEVNAAERTILHNYLSTKYGISLDNAVADKYGYDSGHPGDVAGVGQAGSSIGDAASGTKAKAQSSGLFLDISPPEFTLTDGDYALYGHDKANLSFTAVEAPNGRDNVQKLAREWKVDLTNKSDLTGAKLGFDESALPMSDRIGNTSSYNDYFLFISSDDDFSENAKGFDLSDPDDDGVYTTNNTAQAVGQEVKDGDHITIARVNRTISFTKAIGKGFENTAGNVSVKAKINFSTNQQIDVDASADPLTGNLPPATGGGNDFTDNGETWQFTSNNADSRDVFSVEDDGTTEDTELLKVTPTSLPSTVAKGDTARFEYSIIDDDTPDEAQFTSDPISPTDSPTEGNTTTVTFDVEVSNSGSGKAFFKTSGDAVAGKDYEITANSDTTKGEVSLSSGAGSFDITILDDNLSEADEDLTIELFAAKNGITLESEGNLSETLTIKDDEGVPSVSFTVLSRAREER